MITYLKRLFLSLGLLISVNAMAENQTAEVSTIRPGNELPFNVSIDLTAFQLPSGFHSGIAGKHDNFWLFMAGRTNGLHGFEDNTNNFPPQQQNTTVYVVDFSTHAVYSRSLTDSGSGLTQEEIDFLSVTSPQFYQSCETLYMTGGYGVTTATGQFGTKDALTAIDIPGLIHWVTSPDSCETAKQYIRQIFDPIFQVTGGAMFQVGDEPTLLIFGQNFKGFYFDDGNGTYIDQVRRFKIYDNGKHLSIEIKHPEPHYRNPNYRRRDLNVLPCIKKWDHCRYEPYFLALSGVFTETGGAWTVPVIINKDGKSSMPDPKKPKTFKQGMNNYVCAALGLFSERHNAMYNTLLGGITFGYFSDGTISGNFVTDSELPFINQVTTIKFQDGCFSQYLNETGYPIIYSTGSNPGNQLLFGTAAEFIPKAGIKTFSNGVVDFDALHVGKTVVGYIVGGIQSTLPNTNTITDSTASPYIFRLSVTKNP